MRSRRSVSTLLASFLVCASSGAAWAQATPDQAGTRPIPADRKRPVPDYTGRPPDPSLREPGIVWVPRVLLFPVYVVTEYGIRWPLGKLATEAERNDWPAMLVDFFTFGEERKSGIIPSAFIDFGFRPSVGLFFFADDALHDDHQIRAYGATGGSDWLTGTLAYRVKVPDEGTSFALRVEATRRPDWVFFGLGPRTLQSDKGRYRSDRVQLSAEIEDEFLGWAELRSELGMRKHRFTDRGCCDDPSIGARVAEGRYDVPPSFEEGYDSAFQRLEVSVDSRSARPEPQTGLRAEAGVETGFDVLDVPHRGWLRYGGDASGYLDLNGRARVLELNVATQLADPLAGDLIPFTEQVLVGGDSLMSGFLTGRLTGRSTLVGTLRYTWPVWMYLDGSVHFAMGNVFGPHLQGFDADLLRISTGIGVQTSLITDHPFQVLVACGTETLEQDARITSVRLALGTSRGF